MADRRQTHADPTQLLRHIAVKSTDEADSLRQIQSQLKDIERALRPISAIAWFVIKVAWFAIVCSLAAIVLFVLYCFMP